MVAEINPLKQGLKHRAAHTRMYKEIVAEINPLKQGLKLYECGGNRRET